MARTHARARGFVARSGYKNLEPTISQVLAALSENRVLVDFSAGTGILARRLLAAIKHPVGILNVDASAKFLRVAIENLGADERAAFRLLGYLKPEKRLEASPATWTYLTTRLR